MGESLSFKAAVLLDWDVAVTLSVTSKIELETGAIVIVSAPLAGPDVLKPRTQTDWEVFEIDVGVAETGVATPPEIEIAKSPTSRSPEPPVAL